MKYIFALLTAVCLLVGTSNAQLALAEPILPQLSVDTTYSLPTGGTTWAAHTSAQLTSALSGSAPGDVIVLDAGATYSGNFTLALKSNPSNKWIYIISSDLASLPAGTRVSPASVSHMPKVVTPGATTTFNMPNGSNYWRLAGLEITTASNYCPNAPCPPNTYSTNGLIQQPYPPTNPIQNHLIVDRCYLHGTDTIDVQGALALNVAYGAVIDSEISNIHIKAQDSWGTGGNWGPGPFKIDNNWISASSENILWGGSGKGILGNVPSDITITNNYLYKPLSWIPLSVGNHSMTVKNTFECKSCKRVLFDHNVIENIWKDGQQGYAIQLTIRTYQSGDVARNNDITITNNVVKNAVAFVNSLAADDLCVAPCTDAGSQTRWKIYNNLVTFFDPSAVGGGNNVGFSVQPGVDHINNVMGMLQNVIFQHNTTIPSAGHNCWASIYFNDPTPPPVPPAPHVTQNLWFLDNVLCGQPYGNLGGGLTPGLNTYMPYPTAPPNSIEERFCGNVMYGQGGALKTWPACVSSSAPDLATNTTFIYDAEGKLTTPTYTTTVGPPPPPEIPGWLGNGGSPVLLSVSVTPVAPIILIGASLQFTATANYSDGSQVDVTTSSAWTSSNTGVATVGASTGLGHGVAQGFSTITATYSGLSGPSTLTVLGTGSDSRLGLGGTLSVGGTLGVK